MLRREGEANWCITNLVDRVIGVEGQLQRKVMKYIQLSIGCQERNHYSRQMLRQIQRLLTKETLPTIA
jgi:hypothetical protein